MKLFNTYKLIMFGFCMLLIASCVKHPDSPGYEYMPDMYRSPAIEAYVDYGLIGDVEYSELKSKMSARKPPFGTIQYREDRNMSEIFMPFGYNPIDLGITEDSARILAGKEVFIPNYYIKDSLTATKNLNEGKRLYDFMCTQCHGATGQGDGKVVEITDNLIKPFAYTDKDIKKRSLGSIFHTITYGKGAMGSHASQLNKDERWKVSMYVRTLQLGGDLKIEELQGQNTLPSVSNDTLSTDIVSTDVNNDNSN